MISLQHRLSRQHMHPSAQSGVQLGWISRPGSVNHAVPDRAPAYRSTRLLLRAGSQPECSVKDRPECFANLAGESLPTDVVSEPRLVKAPSKL